MKHENAFQLLHPSVRRVVFELGWTSLRPVQAMAIDAFFKTGDDQLIIAPTAGGKTECWALPALSTLVEDPRPSIQVLCVSPLKALINDQFARLTALAKLLGIPVHRWHGDVDQHHKMALRNNPRGILIVTPESLEAALMNRSAEIPKLYGHLKLVVVDEVHAMLDEERGIHLQSLLTRLIQLISHRPRHIGLSATIGDISVAQQFLNPDHPETVKVIRQDDDGRELQLTLSAYLNETAQ